MLLRYEAHETINGHVYDVNINISMNINSGLSHAHFVFKSKYRSHNRITARVTRTKLV